MTEKSRKKRTLVSSKVLLFNLNVYALAKVKNNVFLKTNIDLQENGLCDAYDNSRVNRESQICTVTA